MPIAKMPQVKAGLMHDLLTGRVRVTSILSGPINNAGEDHELSFLGTSPTRRLPPPTVVSGDGNHLRRYGVLLRPFVNKRSRTHDQMVQAARSGRQNIAEGSRASATSSQTELRLVNVARASLDELLLDYEDFLRQRGLPTWGKDDQRKRGQVRAVGQDNPSDQSDRTDRSEAEAYSPVAEPRRPGGGCQHADLPDSPGKLSARPADRRSGKAIHSGRRLQRTAARCPVGGKATTEIGLIGRIRPIGRRKSRARRAANRWCCVQRGKGQRLVRSSGGVRGIPGAKRPCRCNRKKESAMSVNTSTSKNPFSTNSPTSAGRSSTRARVSSPLTRRPVCAKPSANGFSRRRHPRG